jgi:hypothetical protein
MLSRWTWWRHTMQTYASQPRSFVSRRRKSRLNHLQRELDAHAVFHSSGQLDQRLWRSETRVAGSSPRSAKRYSFDAYADEDGGSDPENSESVEKEESGTLRVGMLGLDGTEDLDDTESCRTDGALSWRTRGANESADSNPRRETSAELDWNTPTCAQPEQVHCFTGSVGRLRPSVVGPGGFHGPPPDHWMRPLDGTLCRDPRQRQLLDAWLRSTNPHVRMRWVPGNEAERRRWFDAEMAEFSQTMHDLRTFLTERVHGPPGDVATFLHGIMVSLAWVIVMLALLATVWQRVESTCVVDTWFEGDPTRRLVVRATFAFWLMVWVPPRRLRVCRTYAMADETRVPEGRDFDEGTGDDVPSPEDAISWILNHSILNDRWSANHSRVPVAMRQESVFRRWKTKQRLATGHWVVRCVRRGVMGGLTTAFFSAGLWFLRPADATEARDASVSLRDARIVGTVTQLLWWFPCAAAVEAGLRHIPWSALAHDRLQQWMERRNVAFSLKVPRTTLAVESAADQDAEAFPTHGRRNAARKRAHSCKAQRQPPESSRDTDTFAYDTRPSCRDTSPGVRVPESVAALGHGEKTPCGHAFAQTVSNLLRRCADNRAGDVCVPVHLRAFQIRRRMNLGVTLAVFAMLVSVSLLGNAIVLFNIPGMGTGGRISASPSAGLGFRKMVWVGIVHPFVRSLARWVVANVLALLVTRYSQLDFFSKVLPVLTRTIELVFSIPIQAIIASSPTTRTLTLLVLGSLPGEWITMWTMAAWHHLRNRRGGTVPWRQYLVVAANDMYTNLLGIAIGWYMATFVFRLVDTSDRYVLFVRLVIGIVYGVAIVAGFFAVAHHYAFALLPKDVRLKHRDRFHLVRICASICIAMSIAQQARSSMGLV